MNLFRSTATTRARWARIPWQYRLKSSYVRAKVPVSAAAKQVGPRAGNLSVDQTFESLGVRPSVVQALHNAFPNVLVPTETQSRLIPAILDENDVFIIDNTGSGKCVASLPMMLNV